MTPDLQAVVALPEELQALLIEGAHRLGQVAEGGRAVQVQAVTGIVRQHPGKHRVLVQVIVCAPRQQIQLQEHHKDRDETGCYIGACNAKKQTVQTMDKYSLQLLHCCNPMTNQMM